MVSNGKGKTLRWTMSATALKVMSVFGSILLLVGAATLVDYVGLLIQAAENKRLRAENVELARQFQVVEGKVSALEASLDRVRTFTKKLRLITNVEDDERDVKLAMGVRPGTAAQDGMDQPVDARAPASAWADQDAQFLRKNQVDDAKGEVIAPGTRDYASLSIRIDKAVKDTQLREQGILELWDTLSDKQSLLNATPNMKPVRGGWYTSRFGYRISPFTGKLVMHNGLDMAAAPGTPIMAPADGVVSFAGYDGSYGKLVSIDHGYGVVTRYGHNSQLFVRLGQKVRRRDVIASVGNTGRSTGTHLHYEVRVNNVPVDPTNYILE